jgi:hypothetical protein
MNVKEIMAKRYSTDSIRYLCDSCGQTKRIREDLVNVGLMDLCEGCEKLKVVKKYYWL